MDELVKQISQRTGISEEQAKQAITQVLDFLKQRLPPQIAQQIDGVMSGSMPDLSKGIGGLFGGKK